MQRIGSFVSRRMWQPLRREVTAIARDYKDVLVDMWKDVGERPMSAAIKAYAAGAVVWASNVAPDMLEYRQQLAEASNDLGEVSDFIRRKASFEHVAKRMDLIATERLDYVWAGPVSLILERDHEKHLKLFKATSTPWVQFIASLPSRVLDVGFNHRWLWLETAMIDYDIPEDMDDK
ncbi:hypothetical protein PTSG_02382 [Salpingoeca rosetta]|uniref:Uncharacterized protein n=1 Tax=Salpingoeca rosetta (strain ATCC 50818 / BSB-021) TaxID=946362 RepID=F2U216_SALR5|nr:uncharacterized protein PTSG_02382 [Salpingoeca rosetta]EGD81668.1 hypothetical protein PTSG_02382 [Salpingoeca rosetta]|eukprot:XP_004996872.1 hypothetical protein PTSG_02382 [Salpingoeca rosetta]